MTEYVDIVTDKDRKTGQKETRENAKRLGLRHRDVHVIIENDKGEILVVKRAQRLGDRYSGYFDVSVGGHVQSGETYLHGAKREGLEELDADLKKLIKLGKYYSETNCTFRTLYLAHSEGPFRPNKKEVEYARFMPLLEIKERMRFDKYTNGFKKDIEIYEGLKKI